MQFKTRVLTPWIGNFRIDFFFILLPPILTPCLVIIFHEYFESLEKIPLWAWVLSVLCIDVAHVYSTLFKTYFSKLELERRGKLLTLVPILVLLVSIFLYSIGSMAFWRVLAYLAVFHFIRQQYGFLRIYSREESATRFEKFLDESLIYVLTLYPVIFWHTKETKAFNWFIKDDFYLGLPSYFEKLAFVFLILGLVSFIVKEIYRINKGESINLNKYLLILGTGLTWNIGIVIFDNDSIFTITNVIAHGIPYLGLVYATEKNIPVETKFHSFLSARYVFFFLGIILALAYIEEGLWAGFVFRERLNFFYFFQGLETIQSKETLSIVVPILSLPQATHYVLDGFIWKRTKNEVP
ncbi:MAG: hypothetical protein SFU98_22670 [Leptospiraceae bacterium]|nr:hypothetical protein [Leptospiraceae bacterium]